MNKIFNIALLLLIILVLGAPSCGGDEDIGRLEEENIRAAKDEIRQEFESGYLSEASLFAHETSAIQKLFDLEDYLQIMADSTLDMVFRIQTAEIVKNSFLYENINLNLYEAGETITLEQLTTNSLSNSLSLPPFFFDAIEISVPLQKIKNSTYAGVLKFSQNFTDISDLLSVLNSIDRNIDIYVIKEKKIFGVDTLKIWTVRLGEIR